MTIYYKLSPKQIHENIMKSTQQKKVLIKDKYYLVHPQVYPSNKFRTTNFLLDCIQPLVLNSTVCDMGCGMGIIGLFSLQHGAKYVVQTDINPLAIENAKANKDLYSYTDKQVKIIESNCFDKIPKQKFDIIVFNIPFHSEPYKISDPLEYAFHDPNFESTNKFLKQAISYSNSNTNILIAFSNKGDVEGLEKIFNNSFYDWNLWKTANSHQQFDNRIYKLQIV